MKFNAKFFEDLEAAAREIAADEHVPKAVTQHLISLATAAKALAAACRNVDIPFNGIIEPAPEPEGDGD
jgi:hypothetical protein